MKKAAWNTRKFKASSKTVSDHAAEIGNRQRFQFGKNWLRFLAVINDERIKLAERSLQNALSSDRLDGKSFLDVGSGSGLFSLTARRLGAQVRSFDYDPQSVACTNELRSRYFPRDANWSVEQGSVLNREFLDQLGQYDIVYAWGVLHHTGQMWLALENLKPLVRMGGQLAIAIYNDQGAITDAWLSIKRKYNALPHFFRMPFALSVIAPQEIRSLLDHIRKRDLANYFRGWADYPHNTARGMSRWYDWVDWIGGYPYECATIEAIVDCLAKDGYRLTALNESSGYGCNEFVFSREATLGTVIENPLPESRYFLRRFGRRLEPLVPTKGGHLWKLPELPDPAAPLLLFRDGELVGPACRGSEPNTVFVAPPNWTDDQLPGIAYHYALGCVHDIPTPVKQRGNMWSISVPDLSHLADNASAKGGRSPISIFENGEQLAFPHSMHEHIAIYGAGRFSHWGQMIYFSTSDNSDPNANGRVYRLVYPWAA